MPAIPLKVEAENNESDVARKIRQLRSQGRVIRGRFAPEVKQMGYVACANCQWLMVRPFGGALCTQFQNYKSIGDPFNGTKCQGRLWKPRNATQRSSREGY